MRLFVYLTFAILLLLGGTAFARPDNPTTQLKPIFAVSWSADGKRIATGQMDGRVRIVDAMTEQPLRVLTMGDEYTANYVEFSKDPNTHTLAIGGFDGVVHICDADTGQCAFKLHNEQNIIVGLVWNAVDQSTLASVSDNGYIDIWDTNTGRLQHTVKLPSERFGLAWSPDHTRLLIGGATVPYVWDIAANAALAFKDRNIPMCQILSVVWLASVNEVVSGDVCGNLAFWNVKNASIRQSVKTGFKAINQIALSPDESQLAISGWNTGIRFYSSAGKRLYSLNTLGTVISLAWSPDGKQLAYGGEEGVLHIVPVPVLDATAEATPAPRGYPG